MNNIGDDASCMWERWRQADSSGDELQAVTASSTSAEELGQCCSPRLAFQQIDHMNVYSAGWLSGLQEHPMEPTVGSSQLREKFSDPSDQLASPFISNGQLVLDTLCNSSPVDADYDESSDIGLDLAELYIRTGTIRHHAEFPYFSVKPACDETLSSESYSPSREDTVAYGKPPLVAQTALQLLQSLDPKSPSSPLYDNLPLPLVGNWEGIHPVSKWMNQCPPATSQDSQPLGAGTKLHSMHENDVSTATHAFGDPGYYASCNSRAICDHPQSTIHRQFDALTERSGTWATCNAETLSETRGNFSVPIGWSPYKDLQAGSSSSRGMKLLPALNEVDPETARLSLSQDLHRTREDRAFSVLTTFSAAVVNTSCTGVVEPTGHLQEHPGKHRLKLVEIEADNQCPPSLERKAYEVTSPATHWQRTQNLSGIYEDPKLFASSASSNCNSLSSSEVMDMMALGPALNTNGKPRARRGSATDPQSVYARHRRNKINERLKTLQHLVPNGAKVDIVTMLEEAIDYVKYLQNQVKLLKMDQWMSGTPTIYNGVDISAI